MNEDILTPELEEVPGEVVEITALDELPMMDKPLEDYTVTEGLLLLIVILMLIRLILDFSRRW